MIVFFFWGMLSITVSNALILVAPPGTFGFILMIIVTVLGSIGAAVYYSFVDAILANSVDDSRRAHVLSITMFFNLSFFHAGWCNSRAVLYLFKKFAFCTCYNLYSFVHSFDFLQGKNKKSPRKTVT